MKVGYCTPLMHVADIERSMRFYEVLGFTTVDTDGAKPLGWARMHCEGGAVMFLRAEELVNASAQAVVLYMYSPDLVGLREHLLAHGLAAPDIDYPPYMPSGEVRIVDPDGYVLLIAHWGAAEQQSWEKERREKDLRISGE